MRRTLKVTRRQVLAAGTAAAVTLAAPALAQGRARVVIVGGGPGGVRVARLLVEAQPNIELTLVNAQPAHTTGALSNLYLAGLRSLRSLTHVLTGLASEPLLRFVVDRVVGVNPDVRAVRLASGNDLQYDRLVLSPGISFQQEAIEGYDAVASEAMPHAYSGGFQAYLLKRRIEALAQDGIFAIAAPPEPARCSPAPYERASMAAMVLSRINPKAKIIIFDAKDDFPHRELYIQFWRERFGEMISWRPASFIGGGVIGVDPREMTLRLGSGDVVRVGAASVSPPHRAGTAAFMAGVVDNGGWAPVDPISMRSIIRPDIYVVGDCARMDPMPKTASAALAQAQRCASALLTELQVPSAAPEPLSEELWSFADPLTAYASGATYELREGALQVASRVDSTLPEKPQARADLSLSALRWYDDFVAKTYGTSEG